MVDSVLIALALSGIFTSTDDEGIPVGAERRAEIRREIGLLWDSIDTLELECEEYFVAADGSVEPGTAVQKYHWAVGGEGRSYFNIVSTSARGEARAYPTVYDDGQTRLKLSPRDRKPGTIESAHIASRQGSLRDYEGVMFSVLWLTMPCHKPVVDLIDQGAELAEVTGPDGRVEVRVRTTHGGNPIVCVLDPDRDWCLKRVVIESQPESIYYAVEGFEQTDGRWRPGHGTFQAVTEQGTKKSGFRVVTYRVNDPRSLRLFTRPSLPTGTVVSDDVKRSTYLVGGRRPRAAPTRRIESAATAGPPVTALQDPPAIGPWPWVLAGAALFAVLVALVLRRRG